MEQVNDEACGVNDIVELFLLNVVAVIRLKRTLCVKLVRDVGEFSNYRFNIVDRLDLLVC